MKMLSMFVMLLALVSCNTADTNKHQTGTTQTSGIEGTVTIGPICPVQQINSASCDDRPYHQGIIHVMGNNKVYVTQFQADAQGNFKIELEPGMYTVDPQTPNEGFLPRASSQDVTVLAGVFITVNIQYDSGIR
jgi:hypothetical protein